MSSVPSRCILHAATAIACTPPEDEVSVKDNDESTMVHKFDEDFEEWTIE